ncbi:MAG: YegS/Rv2252/BmrU family lipid kinase [Lachnospiraceae bacterium]|nr:YegS/Rv2252/BmrU family lipid kinase [Lachnospiraceae bacterium]
MEKRLLFIINPNAGRTAIKNDLFEIILIFSRAGYEVTTYPTKDAGDAERKVIADGSKYDLIVCAGGDGTLENTVSGYMKMGDDKVSLGYIPCGSTNDFARTVAIPPNKIQAAKDIVEGSPKCLDVGQFADKYFIYIASFGVFTEVSYGTDQSLKKVMGHAAYVIEGIKDLANIKAYKLEADFDGKSVSGEFIFGMITNSLSVGGFKLRGSKHVVLDDGKFDCLLVRKPENVTDVQRILTQVLTNNIEDKDEIFYITKASKVVIKSEEAIKWTLDGEFGGELNDVTIINHQKVLNLCLNGEYSLDEAEESDESTFADYGDDFEDGWD